MKLLVSIHDVTPAHAEEVEILWRMCARQKVQPALFVVPDWHGCWPLERHPRFVRWIQRRVCEGAEVLLHGERHDERGSPRSLPDEWRAFGQTAMEGEFLTFEWDAAFARIERGVQRLRSLDIEPVGFAPPAWLARPASHAAVAAAGLAISEDVRSIYLHRRGMHLESPVLRWSGRTALRGWISKRVVRARSWLHRNHWLVRIALHPQDLSVDAVARALEPTLQRWLRIRHPFGYAAL